MKKASTLVLLGLVAIATGVRLKDDVLATLGNFMDPINEMDWNTIDALIDDQMNICADKKVFVKGQEVNKVYAFKLIEHLSTIDWRHVHEILNNHKEMLQNEFADRRKKSVTEALKHTFRLKKVDWNIYLQNFGDKSMRNAVAIMSPIQEQTLKTTEKLVCLNKMK